MAKIETTFIRPQEVFTPDTGKAKVIYDGYKNNPHELVLEENLEGEVSEIVNDTFVPNEGGNVVFTDNNETEHELITEDGFAGALDSALPSALAKAQVIETTWQGLKTLRDNSQLVAGSLYRITDYNCTTTQQDTQSAGHQFDIVLLALSEDKLAEEGWAMMNESNIYDVTFADGVTLKCYVWNIGGGGINVSRVDNHKGQIGLPISDFVFNEINKTATTEDWESGDMNGTDIPYNYFQNSKLEAWKVWYCLDNDTDRFAWADSSVDEDTQESIYIRYGGGGGAPIFHATCIRNSQYDTVVSDINYYGFDSNGYPNKVYTRTATPSINDSVFTITGGGSPPGAFGTVESYTPAHQGTGLPNGRGVIYRLIDEFNNDVAYDFKNIMFLAGTNYHYTFGYYDSSNDYYEASIKLNTQDSTCCINNNISSRWSREELKLTLPFICINITYFINSNYIIGNIFADCEYIHIQGMEAQHNKLICSYVITIGNSNSSQANSYLLYNCEEMEYPSEGCYYNNHAFVIDNN